MAQKINPIALRLGITKDWQNRWFFKKPLRYFLEEDVMIREFIESKILAAGIASIEIERLGDEIKLFINSARPGIIIGRGGKGIEELKANLVKAIQKLRVKNKKKKQFTLSITIEEMRRDSVSSSVIAQQIAFDLEKRIPFRMALKRNLEALKQVREVKGAKIRLSGRLNGAEISRAEWLIFGKMPLQTLRANIDYGEATSYNSYGTIGVKVWIYKGDVFEKKNK